ncbi:MAG: FluC/FEX family fluoride channel [Vulcanococcus sp.]|uniref:FluC/FEX family fluoride channel n=1 Tax=unclassified Vulcanococcus TaxID=2766969 RepID=UPI0025CD05CF|nr:MULTISPECIES: CrcB family protein [unclassified Vulcanococcus]NCV93146.1 CrcB family protein [Synechococcaceae bacterium WB7_3xG_012]
MVADRQLRFALKELALVGCGAVPGAWLRWQSGVHLGPVLGGSAVSDLLVNLIGSLILGFLAGPMPRRPSLLLLLGIGFCGCLTTFSSWMLDVVKLLQAGQPVFGLLLIVVSLLLGLACAAAGFQLSRRVFNA